MAASTLANRGGMSTSTVGTGTLTVGSALGAVAPNVCSFIDFATAGITNGLQVSYLLLDSNGAWEVGYGTYTTAGTTLTRNVNKSSNSNNLISLSGNAQVFITARAEDLLTTLSPGSGLTSTITATAPGSDITVSGTLSAAALINAQTGTAYTILDSDRAKLITTTNAAAQAYSIAQAGASSAFQAGWFTRIQNNSTNVNGIVTITPTTSTINGATTYKIQPGQSVTVVSDGSNYQVYDANNARQLPATATNDAANAGNLGEYQSSTILAGSAISLTTGTSANITKLNSLPAGDWMVHGNVAIVGAGSTSTTTIGGWISLTSAAVPTAPNSGAEYLENIAANVGGTYIFPVGLARFSLASASDVFLTAYSVFTVSTTTAYGFIGAWRIR